MFGCSVTIVSNDEALSRLQADHHVLHARVKGLTREQLAARYRLASGPLGDFCESLHDLIAHVLMWDEISLTVMTEAAAGRAHWSLDPRWETPEAGRMLNRGGIEAGRHLPASLLLHRLQAAHDALLAEFARYRGQAWTQPGHMPELADGIGGLAQKMCTVPGQPAFWHAAIHLDQMPLATRLASHFMVSGEEERSTSLA
jgi:hypothetical protein